MNAPINFTGTTLAPGLHWMPAAVYHADPCDSPALSSSLCKIIAQASPLHAWTASQRLNRYWQPDDPSSESDFGSAVHKIVLGRGAEIEVIDAPDYRKAEAKDLRAACYAAGRIPLLRAKHDRAVLLADPLQRALEEWLGCPVSEAWTEVVAIAQVNGIWCRTMIDAITPDLCTIADIKSTATSCAPRALERFAYAQQWHVQAEFYETVLDAIDTGNKGRRTFGFIAGETDAPFAVGPPITISEAGRELARMTVKKGMRLWRECVESGKWPGYPREAREAQPPAWMLGEMGNDL